MINCLLFFFVFSSGFLAAYIDWVQFLREAFSLAGMQHQSRFLLCLTVILLSWAIPCYVGFKVYETAQSKFAHFYPLIGKYVSDETKEVRVVSYRKVSQRRGSWPLAYKKVNVSEDI